MRGLLYRLMLRMNIISRLPSGEEMKMYLGKWGICHSEVLEHSYEICTWEGPKTSLERISSLQKVPKEGRKENYTPLGQSSLLQKAMDSYFENPIPLRPGPFGYLPISCEDSRADTINKNLPKSQRSNGKNLESLPSLKPPENGWLEYDCFLWD